MKEVHKMKRILSLLLILVCFTLLLAGCGDKAKTENVTVTIVNKSGEVVLALKNVKAKDLDDDDKINIYEALKAAHKTCPAGEDGFAAENGSYGLSMTKLWGEENGGSFGYYVNEASALALTDEVKAGDRIVAFAYTDTTTWSDTFCFFAPQTETKNEGDSVTLTLKAVVYGMDPFAVVGAKITVNGAATEYVTDAEGKVTLTLAKGENTISATSETMNLVPPVAKITIK